MLLSNGMGASRGPPRAQDVDIGKNDPLGLSGSVKSIPQSTPRLAVLVQLGIM